MADIDDDNAPSETESTAGVGEDFYSTVDECEADDDLDGLEPEELDAALAQVVSDSSVTL
jgi:hypothetical protein